MLCQFHCLGHYWSLKALGLSLLLMFVSLILTPAAGGRTVEVEVCMACPANTVPAAFQGNE